MSLVSTATTRVALLRARPASPARSEQFRRCHHRRRGDLLLVALASSTSIPSPPPPLLLLREAPDGSSKPPIVVVALGGNALLRRGEEPTAANQARHAREAAASAARLFFETFHGKVRLVITHGNGPQVGFLASSQPTEQLSVLDAETQGMIGLTLANEIDRALSTFSQDSSSSTFVVPSPSVCLVTRVVVSESDPVFSLPPTKPIGPGISREQAEEISRRSSSPGDAAAPPTFVEDAATPGLVRRAVPSPAPVSIVEIESIRRLLSMDFSSSASSPYSCVGPVICGGGGGVPVVAKGEGGSKNLLSPIDAVIDKDATSLLLASLLGASALLLLTDAEALYDPADWEAARKEKRDRPRAVRSPASAEEVEALLALLPEGSMRPKAAAAARAAREGIIAGIGSLQDAGEILMGTKGTLVAPSTPAAQGGGGGG